MAIKAIFFDFWGTLVENGVRSPVKQVKWFLRLNEMDFSEYIVKFEEVFMTKKYDDLKQGFEEVLKTFELAPPPFVTDKLIGMWNKNTILSTIYDETIDVLKSLKEDYKLILISNTDAFSVKSVLERFGLLELFDEVVLSCDTGKLKSDKTAFSDVLKKLKVKKTEAVMVGDSLESDVKSAENVGIKAILVDRKDRREFETKVHDLTELKEKIESL
jgi:HAD superfamily hydrolase (TIGR01509 family)|tara:strand:- start:590 stop:1237 length:648 start_codon:yes stop_codon:yes gene_type:complete